MIWTLQTLPELSDDQFSLWSRLLEDRAGIYLSDQQRTFLQTQVSMRMREVECDDYSEYYDIVTDGIAGQIEWSVLIDRLVVKETSFFRHRPSLDFVAHEVSQRINAKQLKGSFDVWSFGCSSGEEPYSIAMELNNVFQLANSAPIFSITATDISRAALTIAKAGVYTERKVDMMEEIYRERYFSPVAEGRYQISEEIRERVCFMQGNILNLNTMPQMKVDLIFCQNLLIYFKRWRRENIINTFVERLNPGGIIVIGLGEVVDWTHTEMQRIPNSEVQAYRHV